MTRAPLLLALLAAAACEHDLSALQPSVADVPRWLPEMGPSCAACLASRCEVETDACIRDAACNAGFRSCPDLDPACVIASPRHREFARCMANACRQECALEARELTCLGQFEWRPPERDRIQLTLRTFTLRGEGEGLPARVEVCTGFESFCDPQSDTVIGAQPSEVSFTAAFVGLSPYFRITGEQLYPMLLLENVGMPDGYQVNIPLITPRGVAFASQQADRPLDPHNGHLNIMTYDCTGVGLEGVHFELYRDGVPVPPERRGSEYYYENMVRLRPPALSVTRPPLFWGGFANLPPGLYDLRALKGGRLIARAPATVVLAGTLTQVNLHPLSRTEQLR